MTPNRHLLDIDIDRSYASKLMKDLYFSSRAARSVQPWRVDESFEAERVEFLREARLDLAKLSRLSMANAMDQIGLWNSPSVLRSYAPVGW